MAKIPFYIMEEHHEAFFIWHYAIAEGWIGNKKNTLLHVDEHSDLMLPTLKSSLKSVNENFQKLLDFTYNELSIANFIYPAIYQGMFNEVYWLRQNHEPNFRQPKKMYIHSYKGEGKRFQLKSKLDLNLLFNSDYKSFTTTPITVKDVLSAEASQESQSADKSIVLDIDMDYFSCNNASGEYIEFEVTQETYNDYLKNPYNKLRLCWGGIMSVKCQDNKYYFCSVQPDDLLAENLKVSEEAIAQRIDEFVDFLKVNQIQPKLIDVCRSRLSGYTPNDQWEFIENTLVEKLSTLYEFDPVFVSDLSNKVLATA
ncbi:MAG TPA: UPF0489 family protein [Kamptonema sp.]|nr:UPF0489 family protein [Kamptonema sp.]